MRLFVLMGIMKLKTMKQNTDKKNQSGAKILFILLLCLGAQACMRVHQIDRGRLAKPIMQFEAVPHQQDFITEMHNIREGAAGGTGQNAGGGCGCN